jgi:hypothetical protein
MPELLPASKPVVANARVARKQCQGIWRQLGYSAIFNLRFTNEDQSRDCDRIAVYARDRISSVTGEVNGTDNRKPLNRRGCRKD